MEKNLKRRQGDEWKRRSWREDKELKAKQDVQDKGVQVKKMKVANLTT
jgi:hypothetical protein